MATYSVWNWKTGRYDYFKTPTQIGYDAEVNFHTPARPASKIGNTLDEVLRPLPTRAKYTGSGELPIGEIVVIRRGLSGSDDDSLKNNMLIIGILVGSYITFKLFLK